MGLKGTQTKTVTALLAGETKVISLWKWQGASWSVCLPDKTDKGADYAASKGFTLLDEIAPGEGFWVNASGEITLP